jgi:hypothetical protein
MYTEAAKKQMLILSQDDRKNEKFDYFSSTYKKRRPITAPHVTRDPDAAFRKYEEEYNLSEKEIRQLRRVVKPPRDTGFTIRCTGDYCFFIQNVYDSDVDRFQSGSSNMIRKIPYKSVILAREEARFVGCQVGDDKQAIMWQSMKNNVEEDQVYAFFARNQMTRVAKKCNEELTFAVLMGLEKPASRKDPSRAWDSMNTIYRRLIYADAIGSCQFTEFYRTVPVCSSCYKLYMFLDHQRVKLVLHNDDMDYDGKYTHTPKVLRRTGKSRADDKGVSAAATALVSSNEEEEEVPDEENGDVFETGVDNDKSRAYQNRFQEKIDSKLEFMPGRGSDRSSMIKLPSRHGGGDKVKRPPAAAVIPTRRESFGKRGDEIVTKLVTENAVVKEKKKRVDPVVTPNLVPVSLSAATATKPVNPSGPVSITLVKGQGGTISSYVKMHSQAESAAAAASSRPQSASATMKSNHSKGATRSDTATHNRPSSASAIKKPSKTGLLLADDLFNFPTLQAAPLLPIAHELSIDSLSTIEDRYSPTHSLT